MKVDVSGAAALEVPVFTAPGAAAGVVTLAPEATSAPARSMAVRAAEAWFVDDLDDQLTGPRVPGDGLAERLGRLVVGGAAPLLPVRAEGDLRPRTSMSMS